ncbi:MAG: hypothetical protein NXI32_21870 [bacterium]|nr:hypothetical protein [bacterium]
MRRLSEDDRRQMRIPMQRTRTRATLILAIRTRATLIQAIRTQAIRTQAIRIGGTIMACMLTRPRT